MTAISVAAKIRTVIERLISRYALPIAIVLELAALSATFYGYLVLRDRTVEEDHARFESQVNEAEAALFVRLKAYEAALWGGAGLFNASDDVSWSEWQSYAETLDIDHRFPGMLGIGYITRVPKDRLAEWSSAMAATTPFPFQVKSVPDGDVQASDHLIIRQVLPVARNRSAIGLDIGSEENRRRAAEAAERTESARVTEIIQLVQDELKIPGFLLLVPIQKRSGETLWPTWVYSPIIGNDIIEGIVDPSRSEIGFCIYDGATNADRIVAWTSEQRVSSIPGREMLVPLEFGGRTWQVHWFATDHYVSLGQQESQIVLYSGLGLSALLMLVLALIHRSHHQALALAEVNQRAREQAERSFESALHKANIGFFEWDRTTGSGHASGPLTDAIDGSLASRDECIAVAHPEDRPDLEAFFARLRDDGEDNGEMHVRMRVADGALTWYLLRCESTPGTVLGTVIDITELLEIQQALRSSKNQALEAVRVKSAFLATMSHELRTPLNAIIGFSRMLERRLGDDLPRRDRDALHAIRTNGDHLLNLLNSIIDISAIESGKLELHVETCELGEIIDEVVGNLTGMAKEKDLTLTFERPAEPIECAIDGVKFRQILVNLLSNAIKYTDAGGVTVLCHDDEVQVTITVTDTGIGIAEVDQLRAFKEFQQLDSASTRRSGGSGLGLTLVKEFVELHGGSIFLESTVGQGSVFTVVLPKDGPDSREDAS